jgi:hypothetical protein
MSKISIKLLDGSSVNLEYIGEITLAEIGDMLAHMDLAKMPRFYVNSKLVSLNTKLGSADIITMLEHNSHQLCCRYLTGESLYIPVSPETSFGEARSMLVHIGKSPTLKFILCGKPVSDTETMDSVKVFGNPFINII